MLTSECEGRCIGVLHHDRKSPNSIGIITLDITTAGTLMHIC